MASTARNAAIVLTATGLLSMGCIQAPRAAGPRVVASGQSRTHNRTVASFKQIEVGIGSKVEIEVGPGPGLEIEAPDNIDKVIDVKVTADTLKIDTRANISGVSDIVLKIKTPSLEGITVLGSSDITTNKFSAKKMNLVVNGAGKVNLQGTCDNLDITINGAATLELAKFAAKWVGIQVNGAGQINLNVTDSLDAGIRGSGTITYTGTPKVSQSILGAGSIRRV